MQERGQSVPVLVDASHDNARVEGVKSIHSQARVIDDLLRARAESSVVAKRLKGYRYQD